MTDSQRILRDELRDVPPIFAAIDTYLCARRFLETSQRALEIALADCDPELAEIVKKMI